MGPTSFWRGGVNRQKSAHPAFIYDRNCIPQRPVESLRVNTGYDPSILDINLVSFGPLIAKYHMGTQGRAEIFV